MAIQRIHNCPSTLAEEYSTYSKVALNNLFDGKKVSHILDFEGPNSSEESAEKLRTNSKSISIGGAQFKQLLILEKNTLRLTEPGESGKYILKPIPSNATFGRSEELPANEHLTMQLAKQIYKQQVAHCALVFFKDGQAAYLTKRFDYDADGQKINQEDFATLTGSTKEKNGENYRNQGSYQDIAKAIVKFVSASKIELEKFFGRVIFNYLFCNGDAHLKNFSLQQTQQDDYVLSPVYDVINTRIHLPNDSFFALDDGLFSNDYETKSFQSLGFYAYDDFYEFGLKIGIQEKRVKKILDFYRSEHPLVKKLIVASFLSEDIKMLYESYYLERLKMLNNSFQKRI